VSGFQNAWLSGPIARATMRTSAVFGLRLLVQAGTLLVLAWLLGAEQFGVFAGISALAVLLGALSTLGTHLVLLGEASKDYSRCLAVCSYAIPTTLVFGLLLFIIYLSFCLSFLSHLDVGLFVLISIGLAELVLQPLLQFPSSQYVAQGKVAFSQLLQVFPLAMRLVAASALLFIPAVDVLMLYSVGYFLASCLALLLAYVALGASFPAPAQWRLASANELKFSAGFAITNLSSHAPQELDKTLAVNILPLKIAGNYSIAARIVSAAILPIIAMALSALPRLFREQGDDNSRKLQNGMLVAAFFYGVAIAFLIWLLAPLFLLVLGEQYHAVGSIMGWLCWMLPAISLRFALGSIFIGFDKPWARVCLELGSVAAFVVAAIVMVVWLDFSIEGFLVSLICAEWLSVLAGTAYLMCSRRHTDVER